MQILRKTPVGMKHARVTVAFDGTAGNGAVGTVTLFTITGRVFIELMTGFCTENLAEAGATATIQIGVASDLDALFATHNAVDIDVNEWLLSPLAAPQTGMVTLPSNATAGYSTLAAYKAVSENVIATIGAQNVTDGTIIFDAWYYPVTDNGALA